MILYLDTSAIVKKYFKEQGSVEVIRLWKKTSSIITSTAAYAETLAAIHRKKREMADIDQSIFKAIRIAFEKDWKSFIHVDVTSALNKTIKRVIVTHPLKGFDAIHLASALIVRQRIDEEFVFACYDKSLNKSAGKEGLITLP
jgi:predicted nucleic acid-binding protein